jgi:hypothetical protein
MDVQVSLAALVEHPGIYEAVAVVRDEQGRLLAAPFFRFPGSQTSVTAVTNEAGERISLSIGPVFRGREAQWLVVWRHQGRTVARASGRATVSGAN